MEILLTLVGTIWVTNNLVAGFLPLIVTLSFSRRPLCNLFIGVVCESLVVCLVLFCVLLYGVVCLCC